jgi:hypothetical protein
MPVQPRRRAKFLERAEALGRLAHKLVVNVQDDGIAGGLEPLYRLGEEIASDALGHVLGPKAAVGAMPEFAVDELAAGVVLKDDARLLEAIERDLREWVGEAALARQRDAQEGRIVAKRKAGDGLIGARLPHRPDRGAIDRIPKLDGPGVQLPPCVTIGFDLRLGRGDILGRKVAIGRNASLIAKS